MNNISLDNWYHFLDIFRRKQIAPCKQITLFDENEKKHAQVYSVTEGDIIHSVDLSIWGWLFGAHMRPYIIQNCYALYSFPNLVMFSSCSSDIFSHIVLRLHRTPISSATTKNVAYYIATTNDNAMPHFCRHHEY